MGPEIWAGGWGRLLAGELGEMGLQRGRGRNPQHSKAGQAPLITMTAAWGSHVATAAHTTAQKVLLLQASTQELTSQNQAYAWGQNGVNST